MGAARPPIQVGQQFGGEEVRTPDDRTVGWSLSGEPRGIWIVQHSYT